MKIAVEKHRVTAPNDCLCNGSKIVNYTTVIEGQRNSGTKKVKQ